MAVIRAKVIHDGQVWTVDLPEFQMVPDSFIAGGDSRVHTNGVLPDVDPADPTLPEVTCLVSVPDRLVDRVSGRVSVALIREVYRGNPRWDRDDLSLDITPAPAAPVATNIGGDPVDPTAD